MGPIKKIYLNSLKNDFWVIKIMKTSFYNIVYRGTTSIIGILLMPVIYNGLSKEKFGLYMTIGALVPFVNFADFGLGNGLINSIIKAKVENSNKKIRELESSAFFYLGIVALVIITIFVSLNYFINWNIVFKINSNISNDEISKALFIVFFFTAINIPLSLINKIQLCHGAGHLDPIFQTFGACFSAFLVLISIKHQFDLSIIFLFVYSAPVCMNLINIFYYYNKYGDSSRPSFKVINFFTIKKIIKDGIVFFLLQLISIIMFTSDIYMINHHDGVEGVSDFSIIKKIYSYLFVFTFLTQPFWPAFTESLSRKNFSWASKYFYSLVIIIIIISLIFTSVITLLRYQIFNLWLGSSINQSISFFVLFSLWSITYMLSNIITTLANSSDYVFLQFKFLLTACLTTIILQYILIDKFSYNGILLSVIFSNIFVFILPMLVVINNKILKS